MLSRQRVPERIPALRELRCQRALLVFVRLEFNTQQTRRQDSNTASVRRVEPKR